MSLAERIHTILTETGIDQPTLANHAGVTKGTVNQWLTGQIKSIKLEYAVGIQNALGYNAVWIVMGQGKKTAPKADNDEIVWDPQPVPPGRPIPVLGMAQLGDDGYWADIEYPVGHGDGFIDFPSTDKDAYALKCVGDSMRPRIKDGEFVVIEPNRPVEPGDEVLVKSEDGRVMVKEFAYSRAGRIHLLSTNAAHATIAIPKEQIAKMHFVGAIVKKASWRPT
ncbi:Phage repressor [Caballeronia glathei]|uniref:Repressor n=1 Tax=Caballeronia glathei TaxID=60547 RepID=A0A069PKP7_9BURK|nr:XRE family transcriptional regulator [Caballeronia glathei]KDR41150.1 repressor [Caballeronia glathei]CDY77976.1 Phage repressor [Caballeronia glathei]